MSCDEIIIRIRNLQRELRSLEKLILRQNDSKYAIEMEIVRNTLLKLDNIETYRQMDELNSQRIHPTVRSEISARTSNIVTVHQVKEISADVISQKSKNIIKTSWFGKIYNRCKHFFT
jgi:hypothetical protein